MAGPSGFRKSSFSHIPKKGSLIGLPRLFKLTRPPGKGGFKGLPGLLGFFKLPKPSGFF